MLRRIAQAGWWIAGLLLALVVALGWLQYRWLGALSDAERARAAAGLSAGVEAIGRDLDRRLSRLAITFAILDADGNEQPAAALARWREGTLHPDLVRALWHIELRRENGVARLVSARLDEDRGSFVPAPLPPVFARLFPVGAEAESEAFLPPRRRREWRSLRGRRAAWMHPRLRDRPASLTLPQFPLRAPAGDERRLARSLLVELDAKVLVQDVLADLLDRYLPPLGGVALSVTVRRIEDDATVLHTGPATAATRPDAETLLFRLLPSEALTPPAPDRAARGLLPGLGPFARWSLPLWDLLAAGDPPRWRLEVVHPAGSLEAQVAVARRRNLAVATAVLGVLAASCLLLAAGARRAQALARQRLELVAAVTHELRTPLAAVQSAGANLADGVVAQPEQVRLYGSMVREQAERLARLVEQTLAYTGALASRALEQRPESLERLLEAALVPRREALRAAGIEVRCSLEEALPEVVVDREAVLRALDNLVVNVLRHAAAGGSLDLVARRGPRGMLEVEIADRGPGIPAAERRLIFEPFHRAEAARRGVPGNGLGLAVVRAIAKAHGGWVRVAEREGGGTVFTLSLAIEHAGSQ